MTNGQHRKSTLEIATMPEVAIAEHGEAS